LNLYSFQPFAAAILCPFRQTQAISRTSESRNEE